MLRFYLDFDGVIANSARECVHVAYKAWSALNENKLRSEIGEQQRAQILETSEIYRYLVVPPENYYCLIEAVFQSLTTFDNNLTDDIVKLFHSKVENFRQQFA